MAARRGPSRWASAQLDEEGAGFRFGDRAFREGEYVSVREPDGELVTFKVASVA